MSGYVEAGYVVVLGSLLTYSSTLVARERRNPATSRRHGIAAKVSPSVDRRRPIRVVSDRPAHPEAVARARRIRHRLLAVGAVLAIAAGLLIYKGLTSAIVYFKTADEAVQAPDALGNSTFQIEGVVVPRSVHDHHDGVDFAISSNGVTVAVENEGTPPSLFQPNIPVVLVGHFVGTTDRFASNQILVKHSNQYIAAHPNRVRAPNGSVR